MAARNKTKKLTNDRLIGGSSGSPTKLCSTEAIKCRLGAIQRAAGKHIFFVKVDQLDDNRSGGGDQPGDGDEVQVAVCGPTEASGWGRCAVRLDGGDVFCGRASFSGIF